MAQRKGGGIFVVEKAIVKGIFKKVVVLTLRDEDYDCHDEIMEDCTNPSRVAEFVGIVSYQHSLWRSNSFVPDDCWASVMPDSFIAG